ncbi:MAG: hypothetical protein BGO70_07220 [Bacteroidetes bacterium 43-93]|nr:hypothetical protein [Bacteroidota bacterium]OJW97570.1 MAG: hypothetical protein BGO70_07220 [Bacteroidetes bacterium 43-93]
MNRIILLLLLVSFTVSSNAQKKKDDHVLVCEENVPVPEGAKYIGKVKVNNRFMPQYSEEVVMKTAIEKVLNRHGNVLKIKKINKSHSPFKNDYSIWGEIYHVDDIEIAKASIKNVPDTITPHLISDTAKYALLFVYRPLSFIAQLINYKLHLGDKEIFTAKNGSYDTIKVFKEGPANIWATIETRSEQQLEISFGKVYFIKCEIENGVVAPSPRLTVMKNLFRGYTEYQQVFADLNIHRPKQYEDY